MARLYGLFNVRLFKKINYKYTAYQYYILNPSFFCLTHIKIILLSFETEI